MRVVVYSSRHSVQCYDKERQSRSDSGFLGWAELEPEVLWAGDITNIPRVGEYLALVLPGKPTSPSPLRLKVHDIQYILPPKDEGSQRVFITVDWYDQEKMSALIREKEKR